MQERLKVLIGEARGGSIAALVEAVELLSTRVDAEPRVEVQLDPTEVVRAIESMGRRRQQEDDRQASIELMGKVLGELVGPDWRASGSGLEHARKLARDAGERLRELKKVAAKASVDADLVALEAAKLQVREVMCELVYRNRARWDPEHPNRALGLRDFPLGRVGVDPMVLLMGSSELKDWAAATCDAWKEGADPHAAGPAPRERMVSERMVGERMAELRGMTLRLIEDHKRIRNELDEWRRAARAFMGVETADPYRTVEGFVSGWKGSVTTAVTSTLRWVSHEAARRGWAQAACVGLVTDAMDLLRDDPDKLLDFDPDDHA